jgi:hypothetical protein
MMIGRFPLTGTDLLSAVFLTAAVMAIQPVAAEQPYCPNPAHASPGKVPPGLVTTVAKTFEIDNASVRGSLTEANVQAAVLSSVEGRPAITSPSSSHSAPASVPRLCRAAE